MNEFTLIRRHQSFLTLPESNEDEDVSLDLRLEANIEARKDAPLDLIRRRVSCLDDREFHIMHTTRLSGPC